jgi:hypothetical protein
MLSCFDRLSQQWLCIARLGTEQKGSHTLGTMATERDTQLIEFIIVYTTALHFSYELPSSDADFIRLQSICSKGYRPVRLKLASG